MRFQPEHRIVLPGRWTVVDDELFALIMRAQARRVRINRVAENKMDHRAVDVNHVEKAFEITSHAPNGSDYVRLTHPPELASARRRGLFSHSTRCGPSPS